MTDSDKPQASKKQFGWGRFIVTFIIIYYIELWAGVTGTPPGTLLVPLATEEQRNVAWFGRILGVLFLSLIVYGIESLILRRCQKSKADPSRPTSEQ